MIFCGRNDDINHINYMRKIWGSGLVVSNTVSKKPESLSEGRHDVPAPTYT